MLALPGLNRLKTKEEMKMKKRLLALALCLVMAVSLLPITAAAYDGTFIDYVCITGSGFEKDADGAYILKDDSVVFRLGGVDVSSQAHTKCTVGLYQDAELTVPVTDDPAGGGTCYLKYQFSFDDRWTSFAPINNSNCVLVVDGYSTAYIKHDYTKAGSMITYMDITFKVSKIHEHQWQYTTTENSLKATCGNSGCDIGTVSVTLKAQSVTLPNSPFNAKLTFQGDFKEVFHCSEIEYQYEDPTAGWGYVNPDTFTPKPGNYQAGVLISGLPANGGAAARAVGNEDGAGQNGSVYLFVKYTAADPAVTAQTGDDRPIELMMGSVVVFSILAAAAFVLDGKRKYRQ